VTASSLPPGQGRPRLATGWRRLGHSRDTVTLGTGATQFHGRRAAVGGRHSQHGGPGYARRGGREASSPRRRSRGRSAACSCGPRPGAASTLLTGGRSPSPATPAALASALRTVEGTVAEDDLRAGGARALLFADTGTGDDGVGARLRRVVETHPPVEDRVERLRSLQVETAVG